MNDALMAAVQKGQERQESFISVREHNKRARSVPNGTSANARGCQHGPVRTTPKHEATAARRRPQPLMPSDLSEVIEGQIAEICRDAATQLKRMRQLQEQTDELRVVIHKWARQANRSRRVAGSNS